MLRREIELDCVTPRVRAAAEHKYDKIDQQVNLALCRHQQGHTEIASRPALLCQEEAKYFLEKTVLAHRIRKALPERNDNKNPTSMPPLRSVKVGPFHVHKPGAREKSG